MNESILVVDDEPKIVKLAQDYLERAGYRVFPASDGEAALALARHEKPDLVVLDLNLPGPARSGAPMDGLDVCRALRRDSDVPIIMLTARVDETDRLIGLELGADDYITKPFSPRELVARVRAVLRRFERPLAPESLRIDDLDIDSGAMQLTVRGRMVPTTATEFRLLDYLARHPGRVFTREQLLDAVWRETAFVTPRSVDVYVRRIREKIEPEPENPRYLKTVRGAGYRFQLSGESESEE